VGKQEVVGLAVRQDELVEFLEPVDANETALSRKEFAV